MNKRILAMDDIRKGMFVTVFRGKKEQIIVPTPEGSQIIEKEYDYFNGRVLEVMSVNMPYVIVKCHNNDKRNATTTTLDMRSTVFMRLTPEYIKVYSPHIEIDKDPFWENIKDTSLNDADVTIEDIFKDL